MFVDRFMRTELGSLTSIKTGKLDANASSENGIYPFFTCAVEPLKIDSYSYDCECVLVAGNGDLNVKYYNGKFDAYQRTYIIESKDKSKLTVPYLYYFLESYIETLRNQSIGGIIKYIKLGNLTNAPIPVLSIKEQNEIVKTLDKAKSIITHIRTQLEKLDLLVKARFVEMFGDPQLNPHNFEVEKLKNTCDVMTGNTPSRAKPEYYGDYIEWIKTDNIIQNLLYPTKAVECLSKSGSKIGRIVDSNSILMVFIAGSISSIGRVCITNRKIAFNQQINAISSDKYDILFLYILLKLSKTYLVSEINMSLKGILSKSKLEEKEFIVPQSSYKPNSPTL